MAQVDLIYRAVIWHRTDQVTVYGSGNFDTEYIAQDAGVQQVESLMLRDLIASNSPETKDWNKDWCWVAEFLWTDLPTAPTQ